MTVNTRVIKIFLSRNTENFVPLADGLRLQVLPSIDYLPKCQKHHFAAFIQDTCVLVVWDDQPKKLMDRAENIEQQLMRMIWKGMGDNEIEEDEKKTMVYAEATEISSSASMDIEDAANTERRPIMLWNSVCSAMTMFLVIGAMSFGFKALAKEVTTDGNYTRLALLVVVPAQFFVSLVGANALIF